MSAEVVGFIPARGGSQRVARKNLALVHGQPLVVRTIRCLRAAGIDRVVVSTDDDEIATVARLHGAEVHTRPDELAGGDITIAQVVEQWLVTQAIALTAERVVCVVAEPTCALLRPDTVLTGVERVLATLGGSVVAVHPDDHLLRDAHGRTMLRNRVNSTHKEEPEFFYETGLFIFSAEQSEFLPEPVEMMVVDAIDAIDIDEYGDLTRARAGAAVADIEIRYIQGTSIGSGHMRRAYALAAELAGHHAVSVVEDDVMVLDESRPPDMVVFDILDGITAERVAFERKRGVKHLVAFDSEGDGAAQCSLVFNELLTPRLAGRSGVYTGPKFAILRPEFQAHPIRAARYVTKPEYNIVLSFGGTDPADLTKQVLRILTTAFFPFDVRVVVVVPPLRDWEYAIPEEALARNRPAGANRARIDVVRDPVMAGLFLVADLAITSNGLTVHEAAACGAPVIAIPANNVEETHGNCEGVFYMGTGITQYGAPIDELQRHVIDLLNDNEERWSMAKAAHEAVDGLGAQRIAFLIDGLLAGLIS